MTITLRDLVGAWELVSATEVFADGERRPEFGPNAAGYLSYSPDSLVSATLGSTDRPATKATDPQLTSDEEMLGMARDFIAYAGPFTIDGDTVTHHVDVALFTGWQEGDQKRHVVVQGSELHITGSPRTASDGRSFFSELIWKRFGS